MEKYYYALVCFGLFISQSVLFIADAKNFNEEKRKRYTSFAIAISFYLLADTIWGLMYALRIFNPGFTAFITTVAFLFNVAATLAWTYYIRLYLGGRLKHQRFLMIIGWLFLAINVLLLIVNAFYPVVFRITDSFQYIHYFGRTVLFALQFVYYLLIISLAIHEYIHNKEERFHNRTIILFTLPPVIFGILQYRFSAYPMYSFGYFFGYLVNHVYIVFEENIRQSKKIAYMDEFTGLYNRNAFFEEEKRIKANIPSDLLILACDLNGLKAINDDHGHDAGDEIIKALSEILLRDFSRFGKIYRTGGDEFVALLNMDVGEFTTVLKTFNDHVAIWSGNIVKKMTVSTGYVSALEFPKETIEFLLKVADIRMYKTKDSYYRKPDQEHNIESSIIDILDANSNLAYYVVGEHDHKILYFNDRFKNTISNVKVGDICHDLWGGQCQNCPISELGTKKSIKTISINDPFGDTVEITATKIMWKNSLPAILISLKEIHQNDDIYNDEFYKNASVIEDGSGIELKKEIFDGRIASEIVESLNSDIVDVLVNNGGVGIIFGQYDHNFSIEYISDVTLERLGYHNIDEFNKLTKASLMNLFAFPKDQMIAIDNLKYGSRSTWESVLCDKNGVDIHVSLYCRSVDPNAPSKRWILSVREVNFVYYDDKTTALNRKGFVYEIEKLQGKGIDLTKYTILYVNIKHFKSFNEFYGLEFADVLLAKFYNHIKSSSINPLFGARLESDNFVFLVESENINMHELSDFLSYKWYVGDEIANVYSNSGVYRIENNRLSITSMIDKAKLAKQYVKNENVIPFAVYDPTMRDEYLTNAEIVADIERAIKEDEFEIYLQPIIDTITQSVVSGEALIRWNHPTRGLISPAIFIPILERTGFISKVDEIVCRKMIDLINNRIKNNEPVIPISVNLSRLDINSETLTSFVISKLNTDVFKNGYLRFEITETSYSELEKIGYEFLAKLKENNVPILLDDFGAGYSSFGMISTYDFDILKIDISFIRQISTNEKIKPIIYSIVDMCHKLGIKTVAEGVESEVDIKFLKKCGCDYLQGYYFSKPLKMDDFAAYVGNHYKQK